MNWDRIEGNWKQATGTVKAQWGKLTDDDLTEIAGRRDILEGKIQERYGLARDEAKRQVENFTNAFDSARRH
ncbi:CsbD family protein [Xanthobacter sp. V4C-4]|uniref:CsbD family protein n=1 Tax=Xanthobacter cornucopiae TaxID=3119924 RepID=UPI00372C267E